LKEISYYDFIHMQQQNEVRFMALLTEFQEELDTYALDERAFKEGMSDSAISDGPKLQSPQKQPASALLTLRPKAETRMRSHCRKQHASP
jgi:hypothetical protein